MQVDRKLSLLSSVVLVTLMVSLIFPAAVRADDSTPPPTEAPATETSPSGSGSSVDSAPVVAAETPTPETTSQTPAETPVTELPPSDRGGDAGSILAAATETPVLEATSQTLTDRTALSTGVADTVTTMTDAGAVLVDETGTPLPLTSQQAADALADADPYIVRGGTTYSFTSADCDPLAAGAQPCTTPVQAAINFALPGEVVNIVPGTYSEQLEINKNITVQGTAPGVVIQSPAFLPLSFTTSATNRPIVYVHNTNNASIVDLAIDGQGMGNANYRFDGIAYFNAGGTVQGNTIAHIRDNPLDGMQAGVGLYAYNQDGTARTLNVLDNTIYDYQKNGMALSGNGLTVNVQNNTVTGAGPTDRIAQNGIQVSYGAVGDITGNTVSGNFWTGTYGGSNDPATDPNADSAAGILIYSPGSGTIEVADNIVTGNQTGIASVAAANLNFHDNTITGRPHTGHGYPVGILIADQDQWSTSSGLGSNGAITGNDITLNDYGILLLDTAGSAANVGVHQNSITSNSLYGIYNNVFTTSQTTYTDATGNWWGDALGPLDPIASTDHCGLPLYNPSVPANGVSPCVLYSPWLTVVPSSGGAANGRGQSASPAGIPVTGGQQIAIGCDSPSFVLEMGDMQITFTGLCGYDVILDSLTKEGLPGDLGQGTNFVAGITITLLKAGTVVQTPPAGTNISISFPQPVGSSPAFMMWDMNAWIEMTFSEVGGRLLVDPPKPGTFIVVIH